MAKSLFVTHYPLNGEIFMKSQCGQHSISSAKNKGLVTCKKCLKLLESENEK